MSQEKQTNIEKGIAGIVRNQGRSEINAQIICNSIMSHISRGGWKTISVIVTIAVLFVCYGEYRVQMAVNKAKSTSVENAELKIKETTQKVMINRRDEQILSLYSAAEREKQIHHKYYQHMNERSEGLTDHIMLLNDQLDAKDIVIAHQIKTGKRYREQRDTKNQFMALAREITHDNPVRMAKILGDEDFTKMLYYALAVELSVGLQSLNVLEWIQTLDNWDSTINSDLAALVRNPQTVPLSDYQALKAAHDQQAGRLADIKYSYENQKIKLQALENKFRETNDEDKHSFKLIIDNLPPSQKAAWDHFLEKNANKDTAALSAVAKKHQENIGAIREKQKEIDSQIEDYAEAVKQQLDGQ